MSSAESATENEEATPGPALAMLWWVGLPSLFRRVSASVFAYLLDGVWVFAFRPLAAVATPLALVVGLIVGTTTAGYEVAPFESILLVLFVVAVGTLSGHLGLAIVTGLATGDFFLAGRSWTIEPLAFPSGLDSPGAFDSGPPRIVGTRPAPLARRVRAAGGRRRGCPRPPEGSAVPTSSS